MKTSPILILTKLFLTLVITEVRTNEDGYLRYVKEGCFLRNEALSCLKYKALKITIKTIFGDTNNKNETLKANDVISFVPLDEDTLGKLSIGEAYASVSESKSFLSEWTELTKYIVKFVQDFFKLKGIKVNLPDGARAVEEEEEDGRGRKKKLAIVIPFLTLMAVMKMKFLLVPVLLAVMFIKKLLLAAAFLLPGFLSTLKHCKHHTPMTHYSYFGNSDSSDYNSDYSNYAYTSSGGYGKDWASNRAYGVPKHRPTASPVYITAPGTAI